MIARCLGGAKSDREDRPERDRHLAEDIAGTPLADDALDALVAPDRLDTAFEHGEQRTLAALVRCVLARRECDVGRRPREPLALGLPSSAKIGMPAISSAVTMTNNATYARRYLHPLGTCTSGYAAAAWIESRT